MDDSKALVVTSIEERIERAAELASDALSANTKRAYKADFDHFTTWCRNEGIEPIGCSLTYLAAYIAQMADEGYKSATIARRLTAIGQAHELAGLDNPAHEASIRKVMQGIRRTIGTRQQPVKPLLADDVLSMCQCVDEDTPRGMRDMALLLIGFNGGFRRSELVALHVEDLDFRRQGLAITVKSSKTDQDGQGRQLGILRKNYFCPVHAIYTWLDIARIKTGPVFRPIDRHGNIKPQALTDRSVANLIKKYALLAGLDPKDYSGHSLRSGLATQAAMNGVSERIIMKTTGHKTTTMVRRYIQDGQLFKDNATDALY